MQGKDHVDRKERQTNSLGTKAVMSDAHMNIHFLKFSITMNFSLATTTTTTK